MDDLRSCALLGRDCNADLAYTWSDGHTRPPAGLTDSPISLGDS